MILNYFLFTNWLIWVHCAIKSVLFLLLNDVVYSYNGVAAAQRRLKMTKAGASRRRVEAAWQRRASACRRYAGAPTLHRRRTGAAPTLRRRCAKKETKQYFNLVEVGAKYFSSSVRFDTIFGVLAPVLL